MTKQDSVSDSIDSFDDNIQSKFGISITNFEERNKQEEEATPVSSSLSELMDTHTFI